MPIDPGPLRDPSKCYLCGAHWHPLHQCSDVGGITMSPVAPRAGEAIEVVGNRPEYLPPHELRLTAKGHAVLDPDLVELLRLIDQKLDWLYQWTKGPRRDERPWPTTPKGTEP